MRLCLLFFPALLAAQQSNMVLLPTQDVDSMSGKERVNLWASDTFNAGLFFGSAFPALAKMASPSPRIERDWRVGMGGFGRQFGDFAASQVAGDSTRHLIGGLLREEVRYRRSQSSSFVPRLAHAFAASFLTWDASGKPRFAAATLAGSAAGGYIRMSYSPDGFNDVHHANQRALLVLGNFTIGNVIREFAPELCRTGKKMGLPVKSSCR